MANSAAYNVRMHCAMAARDFFSFRNCLYNSVGVPSSATKPIFLMNGIVVRAEPPFIRRVVLTKFCEKLGGTAADLIFANIAVNVPVA
jgi:hypothetical protein